MAKQVKGVRANKPNDSFGVINNSNLYRGKYREEVYKDEEEVVDEEQQEQSDPTELNFEEFLDSINRNNADYQFQNFRIVKTIARHRAKIPRELERVPSDVPDHILIRFLIRFFETN